MRTGNEPLTARSPLRMRWWLSVWGLIWTAFGTIAFAFMRPPGLGDRLRGAAADRRDGLRAGRPPYAAGIALPAGA